MKIINQMRSRTHSDVTIFIIEDGREIHCSKWNGEQYNDCWYYPDNCNGNQPIDLGNLIVDFENVTIEV